MNRPLSLFLALIFYGACFSQHSIEIYFPHDQSSLLQVEQKKLDSALTWLQTGPISIIGYTDYLGSTAYNRQLSLKRAQTVETYLLQHGIGKNGIATVHGNGELPSTINTGKGVPKHRKVEILVGVHEPAEPPSLDSLSAMKPGQRLRLNIHFEGGRHYILPESQPQLDKLLKVMLEHPGLNIAIEGHICCLYTGEDGVDIDTGLPNLSTARAKAICDFLVANGVDSTRMQYRGFGRSRPLVEQELTDEERTLNRRVEVMVVSNEAVD